MVMSINITLLGLSQMYLAQKILLSDDTMCRAVSRNIGWFIELLACISESETLLDFSQIEVDCVHQRPFD